ncbi:hypothetical protein ACLB2K_075583 [Fragaria x ananassa]
MGGDWQQLLQSVVLGLIFSYLLAKLISIVVSFKDENLTITRAGTAPPEPSPSRPDTARSATLLHEADSVVAEHGSVRSSEVGSDDDWEGVESTELDELFSAATAFVAAAAAERTKVSTEKQLQLYGLYKIATEGPCSLPQPSALKMTARAKWQAWQKLGAMPPEDAMEKYLDIVSELYPTWADGLIVVSKSRFVFNVLPYHEGRTPLHWAVDRGHLHMAEMLVSRNADVNAKDNEGQTALHYAAVCDREGIAEYLVKKNADTNVKDNDGNSPSDLCESKWSWLQRAKE